MVRARRQGRHIYRESWVLEDGTDPSHLAETLLHWSKETVATCKRPFGIDYFDLVLSVGHSGQCLVTVSLEKLRPLMLYAGDLGEQLGGVLSQTRGEETGRQLQVSARHLFLGRRGRRCAPLAPRASGSR
jgi:hypothetical protein